MATLVYPFPQVTASGALPATTATGVTTRNLIAELHVSPAAGNSATMHVYDVASGIVLKDILVPAQGITDEFVLCSFYDEDGVDPTRFGVTLAAGDKANVYAVIR